MMLDVYDIGWMDGWTAEHKSNKYAREWLCSLPSRSVVWCVPLRLRAGSGDSDGRDRGQAENWTWSMCKNTTPARAWDGTDFFFSHSTFSSTSPEMPIQRGPIFSYLFSRPRIVSSPGTRPIYMNGAYHFVATPASPFLPDLRGHAHKSGTFLFLQKSENRVLMRKWQLCSKIHFDCLRLSNILPLFCLCRTGKIQRSAIARALKFLPKPWKSQSFPDSPQSKQSQTKKKWKPESRSSRTGLLVTTKSEEEASMPNRPKCLEDSPWGRVGEWSMAPWELLGCPVDTALLLGCPVALGCPVDTRTSVMAGRNDTDGVVLGPGGCVAGDEEAS